MGILGDASFYEVTSVPVSSGRARPPARSTNLSEGTVPGPCGSGSDRPEVIASLFSQLWIEIP